MINWTSGATIVSEGGYKSLLPNHIALEKAAEDAFQLSFVSDINNRIIVRLNKKECEELSEKLKDIVK